MIKATVVVDNFCQKQGLYAEWGYAMYIETPSGNLLWDTGGILHVLEHNLRFLGIDPSALQHIALSHGHFDHTAGLIDMIRLAPTARLWASKNLARPRWGDADAARLAGGGAALAGLAFHVVEPFARILPEVTAFAVPQEQRDEAFVTHRAMFEETADGRKIADTFADDVSLLVEGERGHSLILGCAHAGLPNILKHVKDAFGVSEFDTIVGGTHLCGVSCAAYPQWMEVLAQTRVRRWRVNHCTGFKAAAELARHFADVDWSGAGSVLTL
ncbi:MAG: MBL fold metallo-hydrolase [Duodenibacillus sp.]